MERLCADGSGDSDCDDGEDPNVPRNDDSGSSSPAGAGGPSVTTIDEFVYKIGGSSGGRGSGGVRSAASVKFSDSGAAAGGKDDRGKGGKDSGAGSIGKQDSVSITMLPVFRSQFSLTSHRAV